MKKFKHIILLGFLSGAASNMVACTDHEDKNTQTKETRTDHVWKNQTDTLKTSKDATRKLQESLNQQQKTIDGSH